MKQALVYSLRVWLTAVALGPVINLMIDKIHHPKSQMGFTGALGFIGYSIVYGFLLSIPCWVILFLVSGSLVYRQYQHKKALITVVCVTITFLPFYLLFRSDDNGFDTDTFLWAFSYCGLIVAGVWFYRLEPKMDHEGDI